ncbi:MAG: inositol-3-phosphate synthase [Actinophytocola sp.]|uniref:inositol-3-phosphate synthase n=1 Tax=Actinophytocola sp. TaxID=1872138 RepID=UPI003D6C3EDE
MGSNEPTGLWLVGARGSVATTAVTGLLALRAGLIEPIGCVTERAPFTEMGLVPWEHLVVGGHDIAGTPLEKRAEQLADSGLIPHRVLTATAAGLRAVDAAIRDGYHPSTHTGAQALAADRLAADIADFRERNGLARVVVVNVSSTEPPVPHVPSFDSLASLRAALASADRAVLPPSSLAAYAALSAGCAFVDFTPSPGVRLPALHELAVSAGLPYAGADGKTGETLLRTVLAPMFTARALRVRSWAGTNLLGGGDGANLASPTQARGKLESKARGLEALLGSAVTAPLHIDNVPDLGEQKTAWDHVSFEGFLGAKMSLQLTWTGLDSALAAPLVLDLARLTAAAHAAGVSGPIGELAFFFKDPIGSDEHRFAEQTTMLTEWAATLAHPQPTELSTADPTTPEMSAPTGRLESRGAPGEGGGVGESSSARAREDTPGGRA